MITNFKNKKVLLFFPVPWANSIVDWITGIHSPNGTIIVKNTNNPNEKGSLALDVDVEAIAKRVAEIITEKTATQEAQTQN